MTHSHKGTKSLTYTQDIEKSRRRSHTEDSTTLLTIREAIALLPPRQGKTVLLRLIEGEDFASIASVLGCSSATARSHFSKGKAQLRTVLEDAGINPQRSPE